MSDLSLQKKHVSKIQTVGLIAAFLSCSVSFAMDFDDENDGRRTPSPMQMIRSSRREAPGAPLRKVGIARPKNVLNVIKDFHAARKRGFVEGNGAYCYKPRGRNVFRITSQHLEKLCAFDREAEKDYQNALNGNVYRTDAYFAPAAEGDVSSNVTVSDAFWEKVIAGPMKQGVIKSRNIFQVAMRNLED